MAKTPKAPAPQQDGQAKPQDHKPQDQMSGTTAPTPQQGQTPVIRDWASI